MAFRSKFREYVLPISTRQWGHDHWITFIMGVISKIYFLNAPLMLHRRHEANLGNDPLLDKRFRRTARQICHNLSKDAYLQDYERWFDMLEHLESLRDKGGIDFSKAVLEDGIAKTRDRVEFARRRLYLRNRNRLSRTLPVISLLLDGKYTRYARGVRTLVKDLVA